MFLDRLWGGWLEIAKTDSGPLARGPPAAISEPRWTGVSTPASGAVQSGMSGMSGIRTVCCSRPQRRASQITLRRRLCDHAGRARLLGIDDITAARGHNLTLPTSLADDAHAHRRATPRRHRRDRGGTERDLLAEACRMKEKGAWERRKRADKSRPRQAQFPGPSAVRRGSPRSSFRRYR